jgi:hypothetical protein
MGTSSNFVAGWRDHVHGERSTNYVPRARRCARNHQARWSKTRVSRFCRMARSESAASRPRCELNLRYAMRLRCVGAAHSRHRTTDVRGVSTGLATRKMRTNPLPRQSRECQQLCRVHSHAPLAGERTALWAGALIMVIEVSKSVIDIHAQLGGIATSEFDRIDAT